MKIPTIGITVSSATDDTNIGRFYLPYAESIEEAGGVPVMLHPHSLSEIPVYQILEGIDGLLLSGGKDVHPKYFNSHTELGDECMTDEELITAYNMNVDIARDELEIPLAKAAYDHGMPIFGVCRGMQLLNIILGGSMVKDIRTGINHKAYPGSDDQPGESREHTINLDPDSRIGLLLGDIKVVNTRHHQGITENELAEGFRISATAPDGIIEAVEWNSDHFLIAVQWHPERKRDGYIYNPSKSLFHALITAS